MSVHLSNGHTLKPPLVSVVTSAAMFAFATVAIASEAPRAELSTVKGS